jgi:hypothetical protein
MIVILMSDIVMLSVLKFLKNSLGFIHGCDGTTAVLLPHNCYHIYLFKRYAEYFLLTTASSELWRAFFYGYS